MTENLDRIFDIARKELAEQEKLPALPPTIDQSTLDETHAATEKSLRDLLATAEEVVSNAADVANSTGTPESINAFANLFKAVTEGAAKVLKAYGEKEKIKKVMNQPTDKKGDSPQTVNNTQYVFNGTTSDLLDEVLKEDGKTIDVPTQRT